MFGGEGAPGDIHQELMGTSLRALLTDPTKPPSRRLELAEAELPLRVYAQAALRAKDGGLGLTCAWLMRNAAQVAGVVSCLAFISTHRSTLHAPADLLSATCALPLYDSLRTAIGLLHEQGTKFDLQALLSGSPRSQHDLAEGVYLARRNDVLDSQPDPRHRARLISAGGSHAGAWLGAFPVSKWLTARGRHYQIALCMRLGAPLTDLVRDVGDEVRCDGCKERAHDAFGFHPGVCKAGNRGSLWTTRSGALERALVGALWARRQGARLTGGVNWFGAAGWSASAKRGKGAYVRADVIAQHFMSPTSHLFLDAAVTDPGSATALRAGSDRLDGRRAAELRAEFKTRKYAPICDAIGSIFLPAVVERYGACCEDLTGFLKLISGDGDRDPWCDDYTFSSRSNTTHLAQMVVFAAVIADACMVSNVIDCDVHETPLTFDDGKSATARREGGAGDHRGRAHAPAYEQPRGSMY